MPLYGEDLAYVHHRGFTEVSRAGASEVVERLARRGMLEGLVIDLGSGSGEAARIFLDAGYDVLGLEPSPAMRRIATGVAAGARFTDLRSAPSLPDAVAVTAFGESITYLVDGASVFEESLRGAARALGPGGLLVFDFVERGDPAGGSRWAAGADWAVRSVSSEDPAAGAIRRTITTFRRDASNPEAGRMTTEHHAVGVHSRETVRELLGTLGFDAEFSRKYRSFALPEGRVAAFATRRT